MGRPLSLLLRAFVFILATSAFFPSAEAKTTNAQLLYDSVTKEDVTANTAMVLRKEGAQILLEVSALATGKGTQFRTWVPDKIILLLGKDRLKSSTLVPYYLEKESVVTNLAPALFAIIGAQYAAGARKAEAAKGTPCSQSGESEAPGQERGKVARAIDQAAMAGGMTLLAKQAKGQMEGRKATFDVTTELSRLGNAVVLLRIVNTDTGRINVANTPSEIQVKIPAKFTEGQNLLIMVTPTITHAEDDQ